MCGIVGYIGTADTKEILLKGLEKLEYRGYDSAGIAVKNDKETKVFKEKGRIATCVKKWMEISQELSVSAIHAGQHTENRVSQTHTRIRVQMRDLRLCTTALSRTTSS